ncbi:MAG: hypothetical protein ABSG45_03040 [Nitrososphaerales archaeon]
MPSLHMGEDVYRFRPEVIDRVVAPGLPGNYVLGEKDDAGMFYPKFIGRSDTDVRRELEGKLGVLNYGFFKVSTAGPKNAYELECAQYHGFRTQLDSAAHPVAPSGSGLTCFLCGR